MSPRTGACFGSSAFYKKSEVRIEGPSELYTRDGQEGWKFRIRFCPDHADHRHNGTACAKAQQPGTDDERGDPGEGRQHQPIPSHEARASTAQLNIALN